MALATRIQWTDGVLMTSGVLSARSRYGTSPTPSGLFQLGDGTGSGQANCAYEATFTIAAGATQQIDLKGGNGEKDLVNVALAFTAVKGVEVVLTTTPAAGVSVQVGPQGLTNAAQLWFQAATTNFWAEVRDRLVQYDRAAGWALDATHKVVGIKNPGASPVTVWVRVIGTK